MTHISLRDLLTLTFTYFITGIGAFALIIIIAEVGPQNGVIRTAVPIIIAGLWLLGNGWYLSRLSTKTGENQQATTNEASR